MSVRVINGNGFEVIVSFRYPLKTRLHVVSFGNVSSSSVREAFSFELVEMAERNGWFHVWDCAYLSFLPSEG